MRLLGASQVAFGICWRNANTTEVGYLPRTSRAAIE
jgi:hypothetical protein